MTVHLGGLNGQTLDTAVIDAVGTFSLRTTSSAAVGQAGQTVSAESQLGGTRVGFTVNVQ